MPLNTMVLRNHFGTLKWRSVLIALCFGNAINQTSSTTALYETTLTMYKYTNPNAATENDGVCDYQFNIFSSLANDCEEYFEVTAKWNTVKAKTRYPRKSYFEFGETRGADAKKFAENGNPIVLYNNQTSELLINVKVWDYDFLTYDDLIIERSFTEQSLLAPAPKTFFLSGSKTDVAFLQLCVTIKCIQLSCGQNCFWPNALYQCDANEVLCIGDNFLQVCNRVKGYFTLRLRLTQLSVLAPTALVQPVGSCNVMITVCMTQATKCETNNWQLVVQAQVGSHISDDNLTHGQTWYDYELNVNSIARVSRVFVATTLNCLNLSESETAEIELQTISERNTNTNTNSTLQIATKLVNFTASYAIECQEQFHGQFCNKNCPSCKSKSLPYKCSDGRHGATCALQTLCAPSNSKFKTFCGVRRSLDALQTPSYDYEVVSQCAFGYRGTHCEEAIESIMNCSAEFCGQLDWCSMTLDAQVLKLKPECKCPPGLQGERCEVCTYLQATDNDNNYNYYYSTHKQHGRCTSFIGNYAAVVELQSFTNYKGLKLDNSYCDQAKSQCDTLVEVCVQNKCGPLALSVNRDNVTNKFVSSEALLFAFELNLTQTLARHFTMYLNFSVYDVEELQVIDGRYDYASKKQRVAVNSYVGSFVIDGHFPKQQLVHSKDAKTELRATLTLRCARGFHGAFCNQLCKSLPTAVNITVAHSLQLAPSFSDGCWPSEALLCNSPGNGVGISCARERFCLKSNDVLSISNGKPQCAAPVNDPCRFQICSRRGACTVDILEYFLHKSISALDAVCECEVGFGGADCEIADWWSCEVSYDQRPCEQNGICFFLPTLGFHKCLCEPTYNYNVFLEEQIGNVQTENCSTMDPCASWKCTSNGKCVYDAHLSLRHCDCKSGFKGTFCELTRNEVSTSNAREMLLISLLLLVTVCIIVALSQKQTLGNIFKCF